MRAHLGFALALLLSISGPLSSSASAGQLSPDYVRHLTAVGFDPAGDLFAVRIDVTSAVPVIVVREIATGARVAEFSVPSKQREERALARLKKKYGIDLANVHQGPVSPDGKYTLMGAPNRGGKEYRILVMEGARVGELHRVPLKRDEKTKVRPTAMLKEVLWSKDGSRLLVIINEKFVSERESYEVDRPTPLRFKRWKIKWYRPESPQKKP